MLLVRMRTYQCNDELMLSLLLLPPAPIHACGLLRDPARLPRRHDMQAAVLEMRMVRPRPHVRPPPVCVEHPHAGRAGPRINVDEEVGGAHVVSKGCGRRVDGELPARSEPDRLAALAALAEVFAKAVGGPVLDGVERGSSSCGLLRHLRPNFASEERSDGCVTDRRLCRGC